ncbi:hypothetical protein V1517DRAFT_99271 [Lipomyces orientalis]|uniref:Uncharacterized protein n=1 Tax=Lipomyces orientalis TaxID=1233043 RepID=A0ACC3TQX6_9ASCO
MWRCTANGFPLSSQSRQSRFHGSYYQCPSRLPPPGAPNRTQSLYNSHSPFHSNACVLAHHPHRSCYLVQSTVPSFPRHSHKLSLPAGWLVIASLITLVSTASGHSASLCGIMYLPLPTASIFFRSQTTSGASENGSENAMSKSSGRSRRSSRSGRSPSLVEKRDQSRKPSVSSSGQMQTSYFMSEPRIAGSGMQEERVYLVAACRRNGCCLNLISEQDGVCLSVSLYIHRALVMSLYLYTDFLNCIFLHITL